MNKTPISYLQEVMVSRNLALPKYTDSVSAKMGFGFKCVVNCSGIEGIGYGNTKKAAKHESALDALRKLDVEMDSLKISESRENGFNNNVANVIVPSTQNYIGTLNEMAAQLGKPLPTYEEQWDSVGLFKFACKFSGIVATGSGNSKKIAKQMAAKNVFNQVQAKGPFLENGYDLPVSSEEQKVKEVSPEEQKVKQFINDINTLSEKIKRLTTNSDSDGASTSEVSSPILKRVKKELDVENEIRIFQDKDLKHPFIVYMRLKESQLTVLGVGFTEQEAADDLMQLVSQMNKFN